MKILVVLFLSLAFAQDNVAAKDLYFKGVKAYQNKDFEASRDFFVTALEQEPNNVTLLYNWGLSEMQLDKPGLAIAAWRKALAISPSFSLASKALEYALTKVQTANAQQGTPGIFSYLEKASTRANWNLLLAFNLIFLLAFSLILLGYWGKRKTALDEESALPPPPYWGLVLILLFGLTMFLSGQKYLLSSQTRATIVASSANMYTGPSINDSSLFEVFEGFEVIVKKKIDSWAQVQIPGGVTGWVPNEVLFYTQETKQ